MEELLNPVITKNFYYKPDSIQQRHCQFIPGLRNFTSTQRWMNREFTHVLTIQRQTSLKFMFRKNFQQILDMIIVEISLGKIINAIGTLWYRDA